MGTQRIGATRRSLDRGSTRLGPERPKTYDGKVNWDDLTRFEPLETEDDHGVLYLQVLNHVQFPCHLRVVLVVDTQHHRRAVRLSADGEVGALNIDGYDQARVQMEFLCRDAKQFTGVCDCQARAQATLDVHFHASLVAVTLAKLEARQQHGEAMSSFSMASLSDVHSINI